MDRLQSNNADGPGEFKTASQGSQNSQTPIKQHLHPIRSSWDDDIFRVRTIEECESIFGEYCEDRLSQLKTSRGDNPLSVLRSCIEILTRLEGTTYDAFAGRVLIFLARYLTFYDRSGLNLKYEFASYELPDQVKEHLRRIDELTDTKLKTISQATGQDIEEGETLSDDDEQDEENTTTSIKHHHAQQHQTDPEKLYERFWKVQMFLSKPDQLYDKNNWFLFRTMVDTIILHFETKPATYKIWKLNGFYMTEPKTFNLQMNDVNMRRSFLIQILLILDFLDSRVDTKPDSLRLDNTQFAWIRACSARIMDLLGNTPSRREGYPFLAFVTQVLRDEVHWCRWKSERCAEPKEPTRDPDEIINMGSTYHKRRKISDELRSAKPYNMHVIGGPDMSRLWNKRVQLPASAPDVTRYFNQSSEKQMESFKDPNTSFRILRLLRKSPYFFIPAASVIQGLDGYLKALADKHFNPNGGTGTVVNQTTTSSKATTPSATPTPTSNSAESTPNDTNNVPATTTTTTPTNSALKINNSDSPANQPD